ncbi:hypothetical protein BWQ96_00896 [Gracilariopsis chorda]|uniref:DUF6818 domain-containing protein n=1 Tax=Gracilariopsis chorda TaxID=448386 RepID=A0A2V3J5C8_9FLOR|nr:hypothetical protein BWQ96_00896 [Gracilariopsis chorda]|eukprot:PXF49322.1 hypothetical protein BWQ96_00896 [Gracilariopsis chorda]
MQHGTNHRRGLRNSQRNHCAKNIKKQKTNRAPQTGGHGSEFLRQKVDSLIELLDEKLPLGRDEWDVVLRIHHQKYSDKKRNVDNLRRKFASLHRRKIPTGDPTMPPEVDRSKRIRDLMTERTDMGGGEESNEDVGFESDPENEDCNALDVGEVGIKSSPNEAGSGHDTPLATSTSVAPRPLVRKKVTKEGPNTTSHDTYELYKL